MSRFVTSLSLAVTLAVCLGLPIPLAGQSAESKLTSVLADLARAPRSLATDTLSTAVQDAMRGGWLRIDANGDVQVYILVSALTEDTAAALTAAGVTIEVRDA